MTTEEGASPFKLATDAGIERERWREACKAALCSIYSRKRFVSVLGIDMCEECDHDWCRGIIDVLRRAIGSGFYQEPE